MRRHPRSALGSWTSSVPGQRPFIPPCTPWRNGVNPRFQSSTDKPYPSADESNEHAPRRRRRSKGQPKHQRLPLDVDSLGKPGEIVVVPPKRPQSLKQRLREMQKITTEDAQTITLSSMLEDLEEEYSPLTPSAIQERIESYRVSQVPNGKMSESEWEAVRNSLASSFTYNQLSEYVDNYELSECHVEENASRWRPGTSTFLHADPDLHTGVTKRVATAQDLKGKALLAERILRDCWRLSIGDEIGQLDLRLSPAFITLLLNAEHFSFDEVASLHQSSIDITSSLGLVRITGRQNACESMCEIIVDAIARIREDATSIDTVTARTRLNQIYSPRLLEWISKTCGVALESDASGVPEKILYLAENKAGADNARRILNLALHEVTPTSLPFSTYFPASEPANVYNYNTDGSVSWLDQQKQWFRWAMPSTQSADTEHISTPFFDGHQTRLSDHLLSLLRQAPAQDLNLGGCLKIHESVTAAVGHCLFARKSSLENTTISASQLGKLSLSRTFSTDVPRVINFLASLRPITPEVGTQVHNIRLTPSSAFAGVAPTLDVKIAARLGKSLVNPQDSFDVRSIQLIRGSTAADYLLPENGLDLRFIRTVYQELSEDVLAESAEYNDLVKSIKKSLRDVFGSGVGSGDPSSLPAFCQLSLPNNLVPSQSPFGDGPPVTAEYILPPVQNIRGAAVQLYEFDDRQLSYSYSETGPFLPARNIDVSLAMEIPSPAAGMDADLAQTSLETEFHSFYNTACRMAFAIHDSKLMGAQDGIFEPENMY